MYTVIKGHGSKMNGNPIHVRNDATLHESVVGYATNYMAPIRRVMMRGVTAVGEYALSTRSIGSAALHLAWVAAGRLTGYWELALHPVCVFGRDLLVVGCICGMFTCARSRRSCWKYAWRRLSYSCLGYTGDKWKDPR